MNTAGLLPHQHGHAAQLLSIMRERSRAFDASDTGTGKTYTALALARELDQVPFVVGPRHARAAWKRAGEHLGVGLEYVNYEKARGRRKLIRGRQLVDTEFLEEQPYGKGSFLRWKNDFGLMIFDEVHRCGGEVSLNSKMLIAAHRQASRVLALSATAAEDPKQLKALGYLLSLHTLNKDPIPFRKFLLRHGCVPGVFGGFDFTDDVLEQEAAFRKLHKALYPSRAARMVKTEIEGFPRTQIDVILLDDQTGKAERLAEECHDLYERAKLHKQQAKDAAKLAEKIRSENRELIEAGGLPEDLKANPAAMIEILRYRQELELLKVPDFLSTIEDYVLSSKVVVFVNFTETLQALRQHAPKSWKTGYIDGSQVGAKGDKQRQGFIDAFQANELDVLFCNVQAGGESASYHDPTGRVERTALIAPPLSGRQANQIIGRVNRAGGAFSQQFFFYFGTGPEAKVANRVFRRRNNIELLNTGDLQL